MPARLPRGRLLAKLLAAMLVPAVLALALFGAAAHEVARRVLEDELGRRLATAAASVSMLVLPEQLSAIGAGDEGSNTYANLRHRVEQARERLAVRRVLLVAVDLTSRGDSENLLGLGAKAHELGADAPELEKASAGEASASPLFTGRDGVPYKRGYARIGNPAAGYAVVEASAQYLDALAAFRRWLLVGGLGGVAIIVVLAAWLSRRMTGPLERLASAAERIGHGDLAGTVPVETRDEIGYLASRLDEMRIALRARDERMQMMLAGIAHEVRNPLGGLELYAGLLREGLAGQAERLGEVARVEREIAYLKNVVTDFLDFARRPAPMLEAVPARELLEEVAEVCRGDAKASITVECSPDLRARADRLQVRRALLNLAKNALAAAGPSGRVVLAAGADSTGRVVWAVRDSGPGVPSEIAEKIFAPFFTTREKGTGLGLAFVREIARDHGGDATVERSPEGGARFRFTTPVSDP
jgi:two-component system, OmpR family, sensor histidine kinase CreC